MGSNDTTAPVIEESYRNFLALLNRHLTDFPFLLGETPSSADFACFGQLTQLVQFDPTPAKIAADNFPRVHAWVSKIEDMSGWEVTNDHFSREQIPESVRSILAEIGRTYVPVMLANGEALDRGESQMETEVAGQPWEQEAFPYQGKCLQWLRIEFARLSQEDRSDLMAILDGSGCEALVHRDREA